jgi:hypothetical protein
VVALAPDDDLDADATVLHVEVIFLVLVLLAE